MRKLFYSAITNDCYIVIFSVIYISRVVNNLLNPTVDTNYNVYYLAMYLLL